MGEADRYREYKQPGSRLGFLTDSSNAIFILGIVLTVSYIIFIFLQIAVNAAQGKGVFENAVAPWLNINADLSVAIKKPWTLLTYPMLEMQFSLLGLASTILWLWAFGNIFQNLGYNHKIIPLFMYATIVGGLFFLIGGALPVNELHNPQNYLMGATTPLAAFAVGSAMLAPDIRFFRNLWGGIPVWVFSALFLVFVLMGYKLYSPQALAIYGAVITGIWFSYQLKKGNSPGDWMSRLFAKKPKMKILRKEQVAVKEKIFYNPGTKQPYNRVPHVTQERIDEILDKITTRGVNSLTGEERAILRKAGEEDIL